VLLLLWLFSKCLLGGGSAIFMMVDNKEQRVCVKFCFLLVSEQSLTENKTSHTLFVLYYQPSKKIAETPPSRHLEKKPQQQ
jgi:hypothetical protein